jgi:hypothetical protein
MIKYGITFHIADSSSIGPLMGALEGPGCGQTPRLRSLFLFIRYGNRAMASIMAHAPQDFLHWSGKIPQISLLASFNGGSDISSSVSDGRVEESICCRKAFLSAAEVSSYKKKL